MTTQIFWEELVPGGNHWSGVVRRGTQLRLTDQNGGGKRSRLSLYNREEKLGERLNIPDTLKGQHTALSHNGQHPGFRYGPRDVFDH